MKPVIYAFTANVTRATTVTRHSRHFYAPQHAFGLPKDILAPTLLKPAADESDVLGKFIRCLNRPETRVSMADLVDTGEGRRLALDAQSALPPHQQVSCFCWSRLAAAMAAPPEQPNFSRVRREWANGTKKNGTRNDVDIAVPRTRAARAIWPPVR